MNICHLVVSWKCKLTMQKIEISFLKDQINDSNNKREDGVKMAGCVKTEDSEIIDCAP